MKSNTGNLDQSVAIIGLGGMFAGSTNLKEYWRVLLNGIDCITDPPGTHQRLNDYFDSDPQRPDHIYCNRGGFLPEVPFDPTEFGIPPNALEATDTSQLLGLVAAKMALSDAGYGDDREFNRERTSVILGVTGTQELVISLGSRLGHPDWQRALEGKGLNDQQKESIISDISESYVPWQENSFPGLLGNVVAGRICNRLNLGGTNCVVDAACASSMSAIHLALLELDSGKSEMVVTGGVDTINDIFMHMCFSKTGVLSHTGNARPFSANADGTVLGEGIGILVLKRLEDARRDSDRIYAVIRGIGASSDGKSQSIYAPRAEGQARALSEAYRNAGVDPETVRLVEAHGTGTRVGDEVEFNALKSVFGAVNPNGNRCALGSVKSMIGHTKAAAGAAGLIKSALALYNKVLPPTIKAATPDPKLKIESSPFYLNTSARPWFSKTDTPRRGGVSAFGFGGSNFHVVLEEYQAHKSEIAWDGSVEILAFSGTEPQAICHELLELEQQFEAGLTTIQLSRTARALRSAFTADHPHRLVMVVDTALDGDEMRKRIRTALDVASNGEPKNLTSQGIYFNTGPQNTGKVAFLFPGQGSQYPQMGRDLTCRFPAAMAAIESAAAHCAHTTPLWDRLYPRPALNDADQQNQFEAMRRTDVAQPAIGAVSLGMVDILEAFNLRPDVVCGHSYGELPALYVAGCIDRETLLHLSAARGRLMAAAGHGGDAGTMLAVKAPIDDLTTLVGQLDDVVLANINSADQGVLSGPTQAIEKAQAECVSKGYRAVELPVAAAFHSPLVADAAAPFTAAIENASFTPANIPVYANATARPYPEEPVRCQKLLGRQMTSSVHFKATIEQLHTSGVTTFVEVGPKAVLCGLVRATLGNHVATIPIDRSGGQSSGLLDLAHAIGQLASLGTAIDLTKWERELPASRTPKMVIPLSGTNYRSPQKKDRRSMPKRAAAKPQTENRSLVPPEPPSIPSTGPMNPPLAQKANRQSDSATPEATLVKTAPATDATRMDASLAIVQQGLASIQALQEQTAQAHQQFLETQAQASRTLQAMMQSVRTATGLTVNAEPPAPVNPEPSVLHTPSTMLQSAAVPPWVPENPETAGLPVQPQSIQAPAPIDSLAPKPTPPESAASETIAAALLSVVAELTGYPEDMLGLEMDIEADLGIDSIKRVEILSAMEERMPDLPQVTPDMVGTLTTLGHICDFLAAGQSTAGTEPRLSSPADSEEEGLISSVPVPRQILSVVDCPRITGSAFRPDAGRWIGVLDDGTGMAQEIAGQLQKAPFRTRILSSRQIEDRSHVSGLAGLILCARIAPETAFRATQLAASELLAASSHGDALLASITKLDGALGCSGNPFANPEQGALAGLIKTAQLEWGPVICRAVDLSPDFTDEQTAIQQALEEVLTISPENPVEVGLSPHQRVALQPVPAATVEGPIQISDNDVVVVTGGARGVTAACAHRLAQASGAAIALIGRSPAPFEAPGWLAGIHDQAGMKKAIVEHAFPDTRPSPKALEAEYHRHSANLAIHHSLERLRNAGVRANYYCADVTDSLELAATLDSIRQSMGPIAGLIHGAGVLHDRLIVDKTVDQFRQVYSTKVDGFTNLLNATGKDNLRHIVLFSSVSARTGNIGQCDYAMANEVLNKMARLESLQRSECRVVAINWGPWDGGMVTASLKKAFAKNNIDLIPVDTGARMMVAEMQNADPRPVEVLIGSMLATQPRHATDDAGTMMNLSERRELDLQRYPVLGDHVIGGKPVVPFALIGEWIGHAALKENPAFALHGIEDFRLLSGIRIEQGKKRVRLLAGKARKTGDAWQVDVELRNGVKNGRDVIHSRARALLVERFPTAPVYEAHSKNGCQAFPMDLDAVYKNILFHGDQLRAISSIDSYCGHGMTARLIRAPKPEAWMQDPIRDRWMADPMVLDGAFQMAIVWCHEQLGSVCLPSYARSYRQYRADFPASGVKAVMKVTSSSHRKMTADFTFLDENEQIVATLDGYEATVDAALLDAFRKNGIPSVMKASQA